MWDLATGWSAWKSWSNDPDPLRMTKAAGKTPFKPPRVLTSLSFRSREAHPGPPLNKSFGFLHCISRGLALLFAGVWFFCFLPSCNDDARDPLIQQAHKEWVEGRTHGAVELFKAVLENNPSGPSTEEALFRLGEINHFSLGNSAQAIMYYQELLQLNKKGLFAYEAQKYIAEIVEFTFKDYEQAVIEYQNLIHRFDKAEEKGDHQYRIASVYFKMQNYEQALTEWEILLEDYPESQRAEETQFKVVEILYTLERCPDARKRYEEFMEKYPTSKFKDEVEFIMASCLEEEGKLKKAYDRFKLLEEDYLYPAILKTKMEGLKERMKKNKSKKK